MTTQARATAHRRPIIFGEVLYDCFAGGQSVLGGAPFNVAWHLQGFGLAPRLISRIGEDELGAQVLAAMQRWGMDTKGIQRDPEHPTGRVDIQLKDGQPRFEILDQQAYDFIDAAQALAACRAIDAELLYHGSLAARNPTSAETLAALRRQLPLPLFIDINLRPPWWQGAQVAASIQNADWLKLNEDELLELLPEAAQEPLQERALALSKRFNLGRLILTLGAAGALYLEQGQSLRSRAQALEALVDTVGAGDAFSAVCILGIHHAWSAPQTLERATAFAARICQQQGATAEEHSIYTQYKTAWEL